MKVFLKGRLSNEPVCRSSFSKVRCEGGRKEGRNHYIQESSFLFSESVVVTCTSRCPRRVNQLVIQDLHGSFSKSGLRSRQVIPGDPPANLSFKMQRILYCFKGCVRVCLGLQRAGWYVPQFYVMLEPGTVLSSYPSHPISNVRGGGFQPKRCDINVTRSYPWAVTTLGGSCFRYPWPLTARSAVLIIAKYQGVQLHSNRQTRTCFSLNKK
jgi:hypothetical protein